MNIVLADDHPIVRQGLNALLKAETDFQVVGEAGDGLEAVALVERTKPDVLVLDLMMPMLSGLEVARLTRQRCPQTRIVILSMHADEGYVLEALTAGASAYVLKKSATADLVKAIRDAIAGRRFLSPPLSDHLIDAYIEKTKGAPVDPYNMLTPREHEVLQLVAEGHANAAIATRLSISPRTVEMHRANAMRKLGLQNQVELVRYALQRGILARE
ncbi:MAG: response regulator transcription factor [Chloroflexota bacterium]|nr:response regulator transcription factor [Chloroflexota bacterium]